MTAEINTDNLRKWLEHSKVFLNDFHVETAEADPFVYTWETHHRPGPSFHGNAHTDEYTDGDVKTIQEGSRYDYPCYDDQWGKAEVSNWTWLLLYRYRYYATDNQPSSSLRLIVKDTATADTLVPMIAGVMGFGLMAEEPSETQELDGLRELLTRFLRKEASFADLREAAAP